MHADPTDRIISADGPEVSPVSVPRIFAVGLVLPFTHPFRLILGGILPALVVLVALAPIERIVATMSLAGLASPSGGGVGAPSMGLEADVAKVEGIVSLALALWLCAWQRAAARGFSEPILRWLGGSLLKFPGYVLALVLWLLAPALVTLVPLGALGALISHKFGDAPPPEGIARTNATLALFSTLQWWVIGIAFTTLVLLALWLSARLSPLPPLVASRGWRRAFGQAWGLSRGHGFGLAVSLFAYAVLTSVVLLIGSITFSVFMYRYRADMLVSGTDAIVGVVASIAVTAMVVMWHASLGALVVRDGLSPAEALDPAMFD